MYMYSSSKFSGKVGNKKRKLFHIGNMGANELIIWCKERFATTNHIHAEAV